MRPPPNHGPVELRRDVVGLQIRWSQIEDRNPDAGPSRGACRGAIFSTGLFSMITASTPAKFITLDAGCTAVSGGIFSKRFGPVEKSRFSGGQGSFCCAAVPYLKHGLLGRHGLDFILFTHGAQSRLGRSLLLDYHTYTNPRRMAWPPWGFI